MRIYSNFREALPEIKRELSEMGILTHPHTMQDKDVRGNPDYDALELQNLIYTVTDPRLEDLKPTQPWADVELLDRLSGKALNPGRAWKYRKEVWEEFLHDGKFAYTYPERMAGQLKEIIREMQSNPNSRQLWLSIWDPQKDIANLGGVSRVPCSLGYLFQVRTGQVNLTYMMRSCDYATHFENDIWLAHSLQRAVAPLSGWPVGTFTHYIGSLHVFAKDMKGVF